MDADQDPENSIRSDHINEDVNDRFNPDNNSRYGAQDTIRNLSERENKAGSDYANAMTADPQDINSARDNIASSESAANPNTAINHASKVTPKQLANVRRFDKALSFALKNKGAVGAVSLLAVVGSLLAGFFGPASMIVNLSENLSITNDTTSKSFERRFLKVLQSSSSVDPICASATKITIKCSMGSISNSALKSLQKKGVTAVFEDGTRYEAKTTGYPKNKPTAYEFDLKDGSGTQRVTVAELPEFLSRTENRKLAAKVLGTGGAMNLRVRAWTGKYLYNKFYNKFGLRLNGGLASLASKLEGGILEKLAAYRSKIPNADKIAGAETEIRTKISTNMNSVKKAGTAYTIAVAGCLAVKAPSIIAAGVAAVQLAQILPPVMDVVLSPGSMAKAAASDNTFTAEGMDTVGTALTEKTPRESDGKMSSALDSPYLLAALGVNKGKTQPSTKFTPGYGILTNPAVQSTAKASETMKPACTTLMSPPAMYAAMASDMAVTVAASATIIGGLIKIAASWAISELVSKLAEEILAGVAKGFFTDLAKNKDIPNAKGEAFGDVLGIGAAAFFAGGGMSRHLPVLSKAQLASASVVQTDATQFEKEMDIASLSPFDTSSRYTFLGSIVHNLKFAMLANGSYNDSLFSVASNIVNLPKMALAIGSQKAGAADVALDQQCDYASYFGLDTGDPTTTPAINRAGLPCTSYTESQVAMSSEGATDLMISEGWLDENVNIAMSDTIQDLVAKKYIKADTPLYDVIQNCSDPSTGDYIFNAAGCIPQAITGTAADASMPCAEGDTCTTNPTDQGTATYSPASNPRAMEAINVFLGDYQMIKQLNGEDEGTGTVGGYAGTGAAAGSATGQVVNGFAWIVDKKWYDDPASHYGLMKGHQAGSDWYFTYQPTNLRFAMDMSPSNFLGAPVYALADGVVHIIQNDRNAAFYIESTINGKVFKSLFAHGQNITVKDGETVKAGQQVMQVGNTGNSAVPHIHWQLQYDEKGICGNDILNNLANGTPIDLDALTAKATENCLGRE